MSNKIRNTILVVSALFILAGTALYLSDYHSPFIYLLPELSEWLSHGRPNLYNGSNFRLKRLYRIELIAAIVTVGSAWFMFKQQNEWIYYCSLQHFYNYTPLYDSKSREERKMTSNKKEGEVSMNLAFFLYFEIRKYYSATTSNGISITYFFMKFQNSFISTDFFYRFFNEDNLTINLITGFFLKLQLFEYC